MGYEGWYEISDLGRVKRIKGGHRNAKAGRILKPNLTIHGYLQVCLSQNGKARRISVHRLVLMAFVGTPTLGQECNHKNGVKIDNRKENLEWITRSENKIHAYRVLGRTVLRGENCSWAKLTNKNVISIRQLLAEGKLLQREIGEMFGVSREAITRINTKENWLQELL